MILSAELRKKVQALEIKARHLVDSAFAGEYQSAFRGNGLEFRDLRDYRVGDDVRAIDWKVTARTGKPQLRSYTEERELLIWLVVDLSASTLVGRSRELILELAALLGLAAAGGQDRMGLVAFTDQPELTVPPGKGEAHLYKLIGSLLEFQPVSRQTNLALALQMVDRLSQHKAVVFVLSDFLDGGAEAALALSAARHDVTAVHIREGQNLRPDGLFEAVDPESGRLTVVDSATAGARGRLAFEAEAARLALKAFCRRHRVGFLSLETEQDYFPEVVRYFQWREKVRHG